MGKRKSQRGKSQIEKVRRADGKVVGEIRGEVFYKRLRASKHFLFTPLAIANDLDVLAQAKERGARIVEIFDRESKHTYRASIARIWDKGFAVSRGHGEQIALVLKEWTRDDETTADQAKLF